jgi:hypothetical protein
MKRAMVVIGTVLAMSLASVSLASAANNGIKVGGRVVHVDIGSNHGGIQPDTGVGRGGIQLDYGIGYDM